MSMNNNTTYCVTVAWGQYLFNFGQDSSQLDPPVLAWGWKATASIIENSTPMFIPPTGWTNVTPTNSDIKTIECLAYNWTDMTSKIALLDQFFDPSNT